MAHLEICLYAPPEVQEKFMIEANDWFYEVEGKHRKGKMAPFISELKFYDVRLPEEMMGRFLRDLRVTKLDGLEEHVTRLHKNKILKFLFKLIRKFNPLKDVEVAKGERQYSLDSHWNAYFLGKIDDDRNKNVLTQEEREVL